ncbi:hypothetical protein KY284_037309 [Solanum tuberosum]|nr:hypothetical protein KY284_037309 [Solanum tuberosum]
MLLAGSTIKEDASKIDLCMIHISEKIEDLKAQVEERYKSLTYSPSNEFPTVGGLSFLDSLLRKLNEMLKSESSLDFMMKPHSCILGEDLSYLTSVFRNVAKVQHKHDEILKDLQRRTVNLAYEVEIKHICVEVMEMRIKSLPLKPFSVVESSKHLPTQHSNPVNNEEIVGFVNETEKLIDYLTQGTRELDVIPIHGASLPKHIIGESYYKLFLVKLPVPKTGDKDDELADMLRKRLMGKRYLIVLDDMWDCMSWDDLRLCFPDVKNRSRIVVTTRLEKVGEQVKYRTDPYSLPFLTTEESCKMLQKKVFQKEDFPCELQAVSQAAAEKCKGLPLVVILVAGIIKKKKMEESWWHEVKNSLLSYLGESEEYSLSTMQLSYDNLTDCLKPCLLYMGMFLEDAIIPASKLIRLWIAEDFVQNIESERLMEEAAEVLHFCLEKSREEKFMLAVKGHDSQFQPFEWKESRVSFSFSKQLSEFASLGSKTRKPFHQHLRSLISTNRPEFYGWNPFRQVSEVRLLKVLDLSSCRVRALSSVTLKPLIHLKYLAVNTNKFNFHPEPHLPHLETLIVDNLYKSVLPAIFWKMKTLRHVDIGTAEFDLKWENNKQGMFEESSKLENLRIFMRVRIDEGDRVDVLLRRCPNLQQLDIVLVVDDDSAEICLELSALLQFRRKFRPLEEWCLEDITFHKLKFLKLVHLAISRWNASEESFPLLETLVISVTSSRRSPLALQIF